jgi:hypothetical protein
MIGLGVTNTSSRPLTLRWRPRLPGGRTAISPAPGAAMPRIHLSLQTHSKPPWPRGYVDFVVARLEAVGVAEKTVGLKDLIFFIFQLKSSLPQPAF